jgi:hypothetical protein
LRENPKIAYCHDGERTFPARFGRALGTERDLERALSDAVCRRGAGEVGRADVACRRILASFPEQPDALHFLGVLRHEQAPSDETVGLIRRARGFERRQTVRSEHGANGASTNQRLMSHGRNSSL